MCVVHEYTHASLVCVCVDMPRLSIPFLNFDGARSSIRSERSERLERPRRTLVRKLSLGICCMNSKSQGNPMKAMLRRLEASGVFEIIIFGDEVILDHPFNEWPKVECLIAFYSSGFPLEKAIEYVRLVKPIEINRLDKQRLLRDRLAMYETLKTYEIPCPDYVFVDHNLPAHSANFEEGEDHIIFEGRRMPKPFVEKPIDGDDHNIWIYYPPSVGGGCKKLIRKTDDKSSEFDPNCNKVRRNGAYLYEPFLPTQGMDVKVYMAGTGYAHAEARKAPTVDGRVKRSKDGKEIRYPIALSEFEKVCGALVVKAFSQYFCGFDVLRTKGGSVVCDVNGWSFVKGNQRYYDDAALLLQRYFLEKINVKFPQFGQIFTESITAPEVACGGELHNTYYEHGEYEEDQLNQSSLRSVLVVMRHGDRRPKEKLKFKTDNLAVLSYFENNLNNNGSEILLKQPEEMEKLLSTVKRILSELKSGAEFGKFDTLRMVLEMHESFEGLTRKVQLKAIECVEGRVVRVLVVVKWGGELTDMGRAQAEELGRFLRQNLFPVSSADGADDSLLRLHSSFRHDFKIYSSLEGRCQTTAAAFTKGFLDLEGDLTPILVSLVCYDEFAKELLDEPIPKNDRDLVKQKIEDILHLNDGSGGLIEAMVPTGEAGSGIFDAVNALLSTGFSPKECLFKIHDACNLFIHQLNVEITRIAEENPLVLEAELTVDLKAGNAYQRMRTISVSDGGGEVPFTGPGPRLQQRVDDQTVLRWVQLRRIEHRWSKLVYGFAKHVASGGHYDTSKVTDLWDCAYYDIVHHNAELPPHALLTLQNDLLKILIPMHAWVSSAEFGITATDKLRIGVEMTWRLLQKIVNDVEFMLGEPVTVPPFEPAASRGDVSRADPEPQDVTVCAQHAATPQDFGHSVSAIASPTVCGIVPINTNIPIASVGCPSPVFGRPPPRSSSINSVSGIIGGGDGSGMTTPVASASGPKSVKSSKVPPQLRALLRQAMRDGSDWHPQLHETVAQITGMKTSKCVRTRVYVTSASTMHSLLNVLAFGKEVSDQEPIDRSKLNQVTDLHYLSHFVIRCFEDNSLDGLDAANSPLGEAKTNSHKGQTPPEMSPMRREGSLRGGDQTRYAVEVLFSPGVCIMNDIEDDLPQRRNSLISLPADKLRESHLGVAPLKSICKMDVCGLDEFDTYLTEILAEFGKLTQPHAHVE